LRGEIVLQYLLRTSDWLDMQGIAATLAPPPLYRVAAWIAAVMPLPPDAVSALATVLNSSGTMPNLSRVCTIPSSVHSTAPLYTLQLSALAETLRFDSTLALCSAVLTTVAKALAAPYFANSTAQSVSAAFSPSTSPSTALLLQFRVVSADAFPPFLIPLLSSDGKSIDAAAVFTQQALLRVVATWPGVPLAPTSAEKSINTTLSLSPAQQAAGHGGWVTILVFAIDAGASVSVAYQRVFLLPPMPPSAPSLNGSAALPPSANDISVFVAGLAGSIASGSDASAANPYTVLITSGALGNLLANGSTALAASGSFYTPPLTGAALAELTARNTDVRASLIDAVAGAVAVLAVGNGGDSGTGGGTSGGLGGNLTALTSSCRIDDGTLAAASEALASLTGVADEFAVSSRPVVAKALTQLLLAALPLFSAFGSSDAQNSSSGLSGSVLTLNGTTILRSSVAATLPPFPLSVGATTMSVLVNVLVADTLTNRGGEGSGLNASLAGHITGTLAALSAAALRAAAPADPVVSFSAGPQAAFADIDTTSNSRSRSYCGPALSMATARISIWSGDGANASVARPLGPCFRLSNASFATLSPSPSVIITSMTLRSAFGDPNGDNADGGIPASVDLVVVQVTDREEDGRGGGGANVTTARSPEPPV
jgi:hypothetical protein